MTHRSLLAAAALGICIVSHMAAAQCRPPASSHEARLLAFYEAPFAFSMSAAPERLRPAAVRFGGEAIPVPSPSSALQHPSYCYQNTTNNTKLAPLFGRPRLAIGLPAGFSLEASYLPNVTVDAAEANIVSMALAQTRALPFANRLTIALRADATTGHVRGAITCPVSSLQTTDANVPCYGTRQSRDTFDPNSVGLEAALGLREYGGRVDAYIGAGARSLRPRFRTGFVDALGNVDHTTVDVDLVRATGFAGVTAHVGDRIALSTQLYVVPADVTTMRISAAYAWR
jgi:hypothetical protein